VGGAHPWREFRGHADWALVWADLGDDEMGWTDWGTRTVTLDKRLRQAERRCTIAHENLHISRGPVPDDPVYVAREELAIEKLVARALIPLDCLCETLAWAWTEQEAAEDLWVDRQTLNTRLKHLHPAEAAVLRRRLEHREDTA